jgi:hypothetical protein
MKKNFWIIGLLFIFLVGCNKNIQSDNNQNLSVANSNTAEKSTDKPSTLKTYAQMTDEEKTKFIAEQADKVLEKFGRVEGDKINEKGLGLIKTYVDSYHKRLSSPKSEKCSIGNDLTTVLARGGKYAKTINDEFTGENLPADLGIYVAMIETEYCPCLQAGTGSLGMFQFTSALGTKYGLKAQKDASVESPDDRCDAQLSARAAAKYLKAIVANDLGNQTNAIGYPLAIATYNSGEIFATEHIKALNQKPDDKKVSFWTFLDTADELAKNNNAEYMKQFQSENIKYVPKFFAAAIVGKNPRVFGVDMAPLSENNK